MAEAEGFRFLFSRSSRRGLSCSIFQKGKGGPTRTLAIIETPRGFIVGGYVTELNAGQWWSDTSGNAPTKAFFFALSSESDTLPQCSVQLNNVKGSSGIGEAAFFVNGIRQDAVTINVYGRPIVTSRRTLALCRTMTNAPNILSNPDTATTFESILDHTFGGGKPIL